MKYSDMPLLFIVYKIIKGNKNEEGFKKIKGLADFEREATILERFIEKYELEFSSTFDEELSDEELYLGDNYKNRGLRDYSHLNKYLQKKVFYGCKAITKIENKLKKYLINFINDELESTGENNFYNYSNNKKRLLRMLGEGHKKYIRTFSIHYNVFAENLGNFRFLDSLLAFELIENYISIKKLYFKDDNLYCLLTLKNKILNEFGDNKNKIKKIYIFKGQKKFSLIVVGEKENKLIEPKDSPGENSWVNKLFEIAKNKKCSYSKAAEAINNNDKLALYERGFFVKTKILKKDRDFLYPAIEVIPILNDYEFGRARTKYGV